MDTQTQGKDLKLSKDLDKDHLPCIISKVDAVAQALLLAHASSGDVGDEEQFYRGLHWILDDAVAELKHIGKIICGDSSSSSKVLNL